MGAEVAGHRPDQGILACARGQLGQQFANKRAGIRAGDAELAADLRRCARLWIEGVVMAWAADQVDEDGVPVAQCLTRRCTLQVAQTQIVRPTRARRRSGLPGEERRARRLPAESIHRSSNTVIAISRRDRIPRQSPAPPPAHSMIRGEFLQINKAPQSILECFGTAAVFSPCGHVLLRYPRFLAGSAPGPGPT